MAKLNIKILGADCNKCNTLFIRVQKIVAEHKLDAVVEKISDVQAIVNHNIYTTPALLINNQAVSKGSLLSEKQIAECINKFLTDDSKIVIDYHSTKSSNKFVFIFGLIIIIAIITFVLIKNNHTDNTYKIISKSDLNKTTLADSILFMYDYSKQNTGYKLSFLEFGSTGCRECKMMEKVMLDVKANFTNRIQVVFYNVTQKENKIMSKHFEIQEIPVQILLDSNGNEVFRHLGFLSYKDLCIEFNKYGIN